MVCTVIGSMAIFTTREGGTEEDKDFEDWKSGTATGTATGVASYAKEYGQTVADAASQAKDFISEKASVVGDKIQDLRNVDYGQIANEAKDYARQNPGQALLIAAAAGFVIGLLVRGGRR